MHSPAVTAIYARKSRRNESALGSCEVQAAICRDTADAFSWEIKEVFADDGQTERGRTGVGPAEGFVTCSTTRCTPGRFVTEIRRCRVRIKRWFRKTHLKPHSSTPETSEAPGFTPLGESPTFSPQPVVFKGGSGRAAFQARSYTALRVLRVCFYLIAGLVAAGWLIYTGMFVVGSISIELLRCEKSS